MYLEDKLSQHFLSIQLREDWPLYHENDQAMLPDSFSGWKPYDMSKFWGFFILLGGLSVYFVKDSHEYKLYHAWDRDERPLKATNTNKFGDPLDLLDDKVFTALNPNGMMPAGSRSEIRLTERAERREIVTDAKFSFGNKWMEKQLSHEAITPKDLFSFVSDPKKEK